MKFFKICLHFMRILIDARILIKKKKNPILLLGRLFYISYLIPLCALLFNFILLI